MRKLMIAAVAALVFSSHAALGQSSPALYAGQVPTAAQWNSYFAAKQDALGYTPLNRSGDSMLGRLSLWPSATSGSGFNVGIGIAPTTPGNGDVWMTSAGLYYRLGGVTYLIAPTTSPVFNQISLAGSTSGSVVLKVPAIAGSNTITFPAGTTDFSATGGASQVVRQSSAGGALTVGQINFSDILGSVAAGQMPALSGDVTSSAGTVATIVGKVNGTSVPSGPSVDQTLIVTGANAATWKSINNCATGLTYSTSTHAIGCLAGGYTTGPGSSTANAIPKFSDTTGIPLLNTGVTIDASNNIVGPPSIQRTGGVAIQGNNSGATAPAGYIGQVISADGGPTNFGASATPIAVASIPLTAGTFDISGGCTFSGSGAPSVTDAWVTINSSSALMTNTPGFSARFRGATLADPVLGLNASPRQVTVASSATYYINAQSSYSGGTAYGATCHIRAIRTF